MVTREAFVNCSNKPVFPPDIVKCLGVVKKGQDGLLPLCGLKTVTDRLREAQDLVFTCSILTESCLFSAQPVPGFHQVVESVKEDSLQRFCHAGC